MKNEKAYNSIMDKLGMRGVDGTPELAGGADTCVCPSCGHEIAHSRGTACSSVKCPECGTSMTGKGAPGDKTASEKENNVENKNPFGVLFKKEAADDEFGKRMPGYWATRNAAGRATASKDGQGRFFADKDLIKKRLGAGLPWMIGGTAGGLAAGVGIGRFLPKEYRSIAGLGGAAVGLLTGDIGGGIAIDKIDDRWLEDRGIKRNWWNTITHMTPEAKKNYLHEKYEGGGWKRASENTTDNPFASIFNKEAKLGDFINLLSTNPKTPELNKAFSLYEKETGKNRNDMTTVDIDKYVKKIRKTASVNTDNPFASIFNKEASKDQEEKKEKQEWVTKAAAFFADGNPLDKLEKKLSEDSESNEYHKTRS